MNHRTLTVAVLQGGASAEAEVSRRSASQVCVALSNQGHTAHPVELNQACASVLLALEPDVVFPALHGPPGEDGTVQGFLELLSLPYVGSGVHGSAVAMDKAVAKQIFRQHLLPVADDFIVTPDDDTQNAANEITDRLGSAVVIKPLNQGSAIGVTPLPNGGDIATALQETLRYGGCLVEPFVMGKEITVGVLQHLDRYECHPVIEIVTPNEQWYDYTNRYTPGYSEHLMPAPLAPATLEELQKIALKAHQVLGLADLSRADFIVSDTNEITLLEVNTLPGMTPTSLYPEGAAAIGYSFDELIDLLVQQAFDRGPRLTLNEAGN